MELSGRERRARFDQPGELVVVTIRAAARPVVDEPGNRDPRDPDHLERSEGEGVRRVVARRVLDPLRLPVAVGGADGVLERRDLAVAAAEAPDEVGRDRGRDLRPEFRGDRLGRGA